MPTILDLLPETSTVEIKGLEIPVFALQIKDFLEPLKSDPKIAAALYTGDPATIAAAILTASDRTIFGLLDKGLNMATGSAAQAHLTTLDIARLLNAILKISLPETDLEKLKTELHPGLKALGPMLRGKMAESVPTGPRS